MSCAVTKNTRHGQEVERMEQKRRSMAEMALCTFDLVEECRVTLRPCKLIISTSRATIPDEVTLSLLSDALGSRLLAPDPRARLT